MTASGPTVPTGQAISALRPLAARIDPESLLGEWQERNAKATLPHVINALDEHGNLANLRRVTGDFDGPFAGMWFADTDVHKTLEAAFWELGRTGEENPFLADTAALLEKAQDPDGYLDSYYQTDHRDRQWAELHYSHEMYTAGHLIQAAVAAARTAPGDPATQQIVSVARRFGDLLVRRYGVKGVEAVCGHPEIETALVELYRVTGHRPYLDLATSFVERRGHGFLGSDRFGPRYFQDHLPVRAAPEVAGHVVRQVYLLAGAVDVAVENRDHDLLRVAERMWDSALSSRTYITGGQGSRHRDEAFGDPYELPPDRAYAETCAAIGSFQWAWRLLLATGRAKYADEMERLLYNGIAASTAAGGTAFFYSNPLQLRTGHDGSEEDAPSQRLRWYSCACCPPNLARLMASLHTYLATGGPAGLQLHLYAPGTFTAGGQTVRVETAYPWSERVTLSVTDPAEGPWTLALRVPAWCTDARLTVNGSLVRSGAQESYLRLTRTWHAGDRVELTLAMPPRLITAHPRVDAVRGTAALARGPVVYCLEQADLPAPLATEVFEDLILDPSEPQAAVADGSGLAPVRLHARIRVRPARPTAEPGAPLASAASASASSSPVPGAPGLRASGLAAPGPADSGPVGAIVPLIPYYLWANRAPGPMRVWIPLS
jgi:DUF1680 family protein